MIREISLAFFFLIFSCNLLLGSDNIKIYDKIDSLCNEGDYETCAIYIQNTLKNSQDKSFLCFKMAQIEVKRGNLHSAFKFFNEAIGSLQTNTVSEASKPDVEQLLDVAALLRSERSFTIGSSLLKSLNEKSANYSSVLFEIANFYVVQNQFYEFFDFYYKACKLNPKNVRSLPGQAIINSITNPKPPTPQNFPWLSAAIEYYDNSMIWAQVMKTLQRHNILKDDKQLALFAEKVPSNLRDIFYYFCKRVEGDNKSALKHIKHLEQFTENDFRLDIYYRHLLLETTEASNVLKGLDYNNIDDYQRVLLCNLWLHYYDKEALDSNCIAQVVQLVKCLSSISGSLLTSGQIRDNENSLIAYWVSFFSERQLPQYSIKLLDSYMGKLNNSNLSLLASLYISLNEYPKAISVMEEQLKNSSMDESQEVVNRIVDYAILIDNWKLAKMYKDRYKGSYIAFKYSNNKIAANKKLLNVPGHFRIDSVRWQDWKNFGPCAYGSVYSTMKFWKKDINYKSVKKELAELGTQGKEPMVAFEDFFSRYELDLIYFVPTKEVISILLSKGIPLILFNTITVDGLSYRHASVICAYDERQRKIFCKDSSELGEYRLDFEELYYTKALAAVAPKKSLNKVISGKLKNLVIPSYWDILDDASLSKLESIDPMFKHWGCRHNGDVMLKKRDATACITWFNECYSIKQPPEMSFYEDLALVYLYSGQPDNAVKYIKLGLDKKIDSLLLLRYYVQVQRDVAFKSGRLNSSLVNDLFKLINKMENINPEYPWIYYLRGDLYMRSKDLRPQLALNAFTNFLIRYQEMNDAWKQKNVSYYDLAQNAIKKCREIIMSDLKDK